MGRILSRESVVICAVSILIAITGAVSPAHGSVPWTPQVSGVTGFLTDVQFVDVDTGWAACYDGQVIKTTDGGTTWVPHGTGGTRLTSLFFLDAYQGWVTGESGILRTTDGGLSWSNVVPLIGFIDDIFFVDGSTGWAAGSSGVIWRTTDGGATWAAYDTGVPLKAIFFTDAMNGWAAGTWANFRTTDGGVTWSAGGSTKGYGIEDYHFFDAASGWAVAAHTLHKTGTGGATWDIQGSPYGLDWQHVSARINAIYFADVNNGWAVGQEQGVVLGTRDGGTWKTQWVGAYPVLFGVHFVDANNGWVVGYDGKGAIYRTTNGGHNHGPVSISLSNTLVPENGPWTATVGTLSTSDQDEYDYFAYTMRTSLDSASFSLTGDLLKKDAAFDYESKSLYWVEIVSSDQANGWNSQQFPIQVTNVNETPTDIACDDLAISENAGANAVVGTLSTTDPDAPKTPQTFTYSVVGGTDAAAFNTSGSQLRASWNLDYETKKTYSVTVRSTDQGGLYRDKTFGVTVADENDPPSAPVLQAYPGGLYEPGGNPVGRLVSTDQDPTDTVVLQLLSGGDSGAFYLQGGGAADLWRSVDFDFETKATYALSVRAVDSRGAASPPTPITLSVMDTPEVPTDLLLAPSAIDEHAGAGAYVGNVHAVDQDAWSFHWFAITGGSDGALFTLTDTGPFGPDPQRTLRANVDFDFETKSTYEVEITVFDDAGAFTKMFNIVVNNVNEGPTDVSLSSTSLAENAGPDAAVGTLFTTDPDEPATPQTFTYSIVGGEDAGSFNIEGDELRATAALDFETQSSYEVTVRTTDSGIPGHVLDKTFAIAVTDVNEPPVAADDAYSVDEDASLGVSFADLLANDYDVDAGARLAVVVLDLPDYGVLVPGVLSADYLPAPDYNGSDGFTYRAFDGELISNPARVAMTVNPVNDAPSFVAGDSVIVAEDSPAYSAVWASSISAGPDNEASQALTFETTNTNPVLFSVQPTIASDGTLSFTPAPDASGNATVTVKLTDDDTAGGAALSTSKTCTIGLIPAVTVGEVATAPELAAIGDKAVDELAPLTFTATATDTDLPADTLTFSLGAGAPTGAGIDADTGEFTWTPSEAQGPGAYDITVTVSDGTLSDSETITVTVSEVATAGPSRRTGSRDTSSEQPDAGATSAVAITTPATDSTSATSTAGSGDDDAEMGSDAGEPDERARAESPTDADEGRLLWPLWLVLALAGLGLLGWFVRGRRMKGDAA